MIIYLGVLAFPNWDIYGKLALYNPFTNGDRFYIYQLLTHMFIHSRDIFFHVLLNMVALWMFGSQMEKILGLKRFLKVYFLSGLFAAFAQILFNLGVVYFLTNDLNVYNYSFDILSEKLSKEQIIGLEKAIFTPMVGASGAISGIIGAFARYFPHQKIFIFPIPFPIAVRKALVLFIILSSLSAFFNIFSYMAHFAHIGGIITGYVMANFYLKKPHVF